MKGIILFWMLSLQLVSNAKDNTLFPSSVSVKEKHLYNVRYGNDREQKMDLYLPANRAAGKTKIFILIHGGGWHAGDKNDMGNQILLLHAAFPDYAIANVNYRLATTKSLGFPKQINDLQKAILYLNSQAAEYQIGKEFAIIGASAGAHLALLYGYKYNVGRQVKAICSIAGPTDFSDPGYAESSIFGSGLNFLIGPYKSYDENPILFNTVSPIKQVSRSAPKTLMFYGGLDSLVPATQSKRLKQKLDALHITNEQYIYDSAAHGNWTEKQANDISIKTIAFFRKYF